MHRKPYQKLAMGGTFDHLHIGHHHFIDFAANLSDQIVIGLTTPKLLKGKNFSDQIQDFHTRKRHLINYCKKNNYNCLIVPLDDPYGPPINKEDNFDALAVTEFTTSGAKAINDLRQTMRMRPLQVHVCGMLRDHDGKVISSTRIRAGEINREGEIYLSHFSQDFILSDNMKSFFSKPQGEIVNTVKRKGYTAIVGDTTLKHVIENGTKFDVSIFDGKEQRKQTSLPVEKNQIDLSCKNPSGQISLDLIKTLTLALKNKNRYLFVDGEEDLATVALVLMLPLGSTVYYGQPKQGIVELNITPILKDKFLQALTEKT